MADCDALCPSRLQDITRIRFRGYKATRKEVKKCTSCAALSSSSLLATHNTTSGVVIGKLHTKVLIAFLPPRRKAREVPQSSRGVLAGVGRQHGAAMPLRRARDRSICGARCREICVPSISTRLPPRRCAGGVFPLRRPSPAATATRRQRLETALTRSVSSAQEQRDRAERRFKEVAAAYEVPSPGLHPD
jgi:hypothetical protein